MKPGASYYAGGYRISVEGVPIRLEHKPSANNLADLRSWERERGRNNWSWLSPRERAQARAKYAHDAIASYAEMLGISIKKAKAKIEAQRAHEIANPPRDESLEYDL